MSEYDSKIVLVTGGAGFIGSNFIHYLLNKYPGYKIINFDKLTYAGNLNNLSSIEGNLHYVFVKGDVAHKQDVKNVFEAFNPDYVVHFAAESHVDRSILNPDIFLQTNILGTQNMLQYSMEYNVERFIHISTDEVYGSLDSVSYSMEDDAITPNNPYAASKASSDLLVRVAFRTHGFNTGIIRSCNNFGAYQYPEKLIPVIVNNAINDKEIPVFGNGMNIRNWIHVSDNCRAIDLVLHQGKPGEVYNVGTNNEWGNLDLVKQILKSLEKSEDLITFVDDRKGHDKRYAVDFSKLENELGWTPQVEFEDGLSQTISWYLNHQEWVNDIATGVYTEYYNTNYRKS